MFSVGNSNLRSHMTKCLIYQLLALSLSVPEKVCTVAVKSKIYRTIKLLIPNWKQYTFPLPPHLLTFCSDFPGMLFLCCKLYFWPMLLMYGLLRQRRLNLGPLFQGHWCSQAQNSRPPFIEDIKANALWFMK